MSGCNHIVSASGPTGSHVNAGAMHHTSVWALVGTDIAKVNDMFTVQPLQKGGKAGYFDLADWED